MSSALVEAWASTVVGSSFRGERAGIDCCHGVLRPHEHNRLLLFRRRKKAMRCITF